MSTAIDNPYYSPEFHGEYELISIGRLDLEEGGSIPDCHLAVATFGTLSAAKDNAIFVSTWYSGTHQIFRDDYIGEGHALDPSNVLHRGDRPDRQRPVDLAPQRVGSERRPGDVELPEGPHR